MNPAATTEFRENRRKFTFDDLKPYEGKWVAFSADGSRIVDSDEDFGNLFDRVHVSKEPVAYDRIEFDYNMIYLGAAEFS